MIKNWEKFIESVASPERYFYFKGRMMPSQGDDVTSSIIVFDDKGHSIKYVHSLNKTLDGWKISKLLEKKKGWPAK